jgi:hypothetical protein
MQSQRTRARARVLCFTFGQEADDWRARGERRSEENKLTLEYTYVIYKCYVDCQNLLIFCSHFAGGRP